MTDPVGQIGGFGSGVILGVNVIQSLLGVYSVRHRISNLLPETFVADIVHAGSLMVTSHTPSLPSSIYFRRYSRPVAGVTSCVPWFLRFSHFSPVVPLGTKSSGKYSCNTALVAFSGRF